MTKEGIKSWSKGLSLYSVLWLLCASFLIGIFHANGKSLIWSPDGLYQHFISFCYLCDYVQNLVCGQQLGSYFNFTIGQGMDVITTLNSYDLTDPISFLCSLLFPLSKECRYTLMLFVKLYLVGFSFIFYCYVIEQKDNLAVTAGAIAYTFSGAILFMFARHPNFISWAYFFPLLLVGVELYFRKGKRIPIVLIVFLNLLVNYYVFYINALLVILYVLVHAVCNAIHEKSCITVKRECGKCINLGGLCLIGILLSSVILVPTFYAFLNSSRTPEATGYTASLWHYTAIYYLKLTINIFTALRNPGFTSILGLNAVLVVPLILIFVKSSRYTALKLLIFISFTMLCIPLVGRIMNGFSYASNRWAFVIPFYLSVALVVIFSEIKEASKKEKILVVLLVITYVFLCFLYKPVHRDLQNYSAMLLLAAVVTVLTVVWRYKGIGCRTVMFLLVIAGAAFQIYFTFVGSTGEYVNQFVDNSKINNRLKNVSNTVVAELDNGFYRVETEDIKRRNTNLYNKVRGTDFWWSLVPSCVMNYHINLALDSVVQNGNVQGLDGRTGLLALASTKYYTRPSKKAGLVPYGYEEIQSPNKRYQVFKNTYILPIGYAYSSYITADAYNVMNGIEKEQALLQGAVLGEKVQGFELTDATFNYKVLDYEVKGTQAVTIKNDEINVKKELGTLSLSAVVPNDCEVYVYIRNVQLAKSHDKMRLSVNRKNGSYSVGKTTIITNPRHNWHVPRDDIAFNLGYGYAGENTITFTFGSKETVYFDDIQIIAVPMSSYIEHVKKLGENVLENVKVGNDEITGTISLPEKRILALSVPYSSGWKAYVDGEETNILRSNVMYMAIPLSAGDHSIKLHYKTPYLKEGAIVSGITALLWVIYEFRRRKAKVATT